MATLKNLVDDKVSNTVPLNDPERKKEKRSMAKSFVEAARAGNKIWFVLKDSSGGVLVQITYSALVTLLLCIMFIGGVGLKASWFVAIVLIIFLLYIRASVRVER